MVFKNSSETEMTRCENPDLYSMSNAVLRKKQRGPTLSSQGPDDGLLPGGAGPREASDSEE